MEGNYTFKEWCRKKGYPASYVELQRESNLNSTELLDKRWEEICEEYDNENLTPKKSGGVITPTSFGPHLKKQ
jgi:hypothetical protein